MHLHISSNLPISSKSQNRLSKIMYSSYSICSCSLFLCLDTFLLFAMLFLCRSVSGSKVILSFTIFALFFREKCQVKVQRHRTNIHRLLSSLIL